MQTDRVRIRAAAIIVKDDRVAVIKRRKKGRSYVIFPGGGVKPGESPEAACLREVREELGLGVLINGPGTVIKRRDGLQHFFPAITTEERLVLGEPEASRNCPANSYEPAWVPLAELRRMKVKPKAALALLPQPTNGRPHPQASQTVVPIGTQASTISPLASTRSPSGSATGPAEQLMRQRQPSSRRK